MELAINPQVRAEGGTPRQQLKSVSRQFEALLLSQTFSAMRETVPDDGLVKTGFAGDMYQDMFDRQVASLGTDSGGMGLGQALYAYLEQGLAGQAAPGQAGPDGPSSSSSASGLDRRA
jgi:Rod binding domain-containing protein